MATDIVLRSIKSAALTHAEMDQNWESLAQTVDAIVANYTVLVTDQNKILESSISSGTITLPTLADAAGTDTDSFSITIKNVNASSLTVEGNGSETIEGSLSITLLENEIAKFTLDSSVAEWKITGFYNPNLVGITATAAELNTLDGITATVTELNYSDGVTSAIQTQLNNKQPLDSDLTAIAALSNANSNFIVGNGSAWIAESGATARASLGVDPSGTDNSTDVTLAGTPNYITLAGQVITRALISLTSHITGILPLANGGTNSSTAAGARSSLGVDAAGTDNSTNVSLAGTPNYLTIAGQVITRALINLTSHVTGTLPLANGGTNATTAAGARTSLGLVELASSLTAESNYHYIITRTGGSGADEVIMGNRALNTGVVFSTTYIKTADFIVPVDGTYRVLTDVKAGEGTAAVRIYKNSVAFGSESSTSSTTVFTTLSEDLVFLAGDLLQIYVKQTTVSGYSSGTLWRIQIGSSMYGALQFILIQQSAEVYALEVV